MYVSAITPILRVTSLPQSFAWFESLGWKRVFSWNDSGMISNAADRDAHGEVEIFLCHGGQGSLGTLRPEFPGDDSTDGVWMTWWLKSWAELDAVHAVAISKQMDVSMPPRDEPWGVREFHLRHPDGHTFRVSARGKRE